MAETDIFAPWRAALAARELRIPQCSSCGSWNWYPLPSCRVCQADRFEWRSVAPRGTLYSWTRVHRAFTRRLSMSLPYVVGVVDLEGAPGVRLVCRAAGTVADPLTGSPVNLSPELDGDEPYWLFEAVD
ncbi:MAG TPA: hypothetical protein EYO87_10345 [Paracoccus sp.]|nr:hypothetical protein [Paracoccus sp. (in: a-proteobacteria)]